MQPLGDFFSSGAAARRINDIVAKATKPVLEAMGVIVLRCDFPEDVIPTVEAAMTMVFQSGETVAVLLSQRLIGAKKFGTIRQDFQAVLDKAGITGITANFLKVLTTNRRLFAVSDVIRTYRALVAKFKGEATADVAVAEKLSDKNLEALKAALKSVTGKDVALNINVDPAIIGGLVVKLGSRMVDSSLRTKLNSIKIAMKEAR